MKDNNLEAERDSNGKFKLRAIPGYESVKAYEQML